MSLWSYGANTLPNPLITDCLKTQISVFCYEMTDLKGNEKRRTLYFFWHLLNVQDLKYMYTCDTPKI